MSLIALLLLTGCVGPWGAAKRANSVESYADFLAAYPTSPRVEAARERAEVLRWERAEVRRDSESYRAYLYAHPEGPHARSASVELDHATYREAVDRRGLETYLLTLSQGVHAKEVRASLQELDWSEAHQKGTANSYGKYILHHSKGPHAPEARTLRDDLIWQDVVAKDSVHGYRRYLTGYLTGAHRQEAEARIEQLVFTRARILVRGRTSWRANGEALADGVAREVKRGFAKYLVALGYDTTVPVVAMDFTDVAQPPHPLDSQPVEAGTGLFVIDLDERRGERMREAYATIIKATVAVYAPSKREAMSSDWVEVRTSPYLVVRSDQMSMHLDAEVRIADALISSVRPGDFLKALEDPVEAAPVIRDAAKQTQRVDQVADEGSLERLLRQ